jgi:hypothetical protein
MLAGMQLGLKSLAAAGATQVMTLLNAPGGRFEFGPGGAGGGGAAALNAPGFAAYLDQVAATGVPDLAMPTFSAHQMGTARLGECRRAGAHRCLHLPAGLGRGACLGCWG